MAFRFLDADGNGTLSKEEFETVMMNVGDPLTKEEVDLTFSYFDVDKNGEIEYYEFLQFFKRQPEIEGHTGSSPSKHIKQKSQRDIKKALMSQRSKMKEKLKRSNTTMPRSTSNDFEGGSRQMLTNSNVDGDNTKKTQDNIKKLPTAEADKMLLRSFSAGT